MDSYSGIIINQAESCEHFTDITPMPCNGFNILCKARRYGRWWTLKGLKEPFRQQEAYRLLLQKEFDILVSMQHPGIVAASSMEEVPGMGRCIVMEWIDGTTLQRWIDKRALTSHATHTHHRSQEPDEGESIFLQLLDAVSYVHAKQVVHRDLKPSNIMIAYNGSHVKLIDFGLADTDSYAVLKQPAGTPSYMSPEQKKSRQANLRNDIYSLGCILEQMQLGNAYSSIVKRCKAPIGKRYANADELKSDFIARSKKRHTAAPLLRHTAMAAAAAITAAGIGCALLYMPLKPNPASSSTYNDSATHTESAQRANTASAHAADQQKSQEATLATTPTSPLQAAASLADSGKRIIDRMWRDSGIDTIHDVKVKSDALYQFVDSSNHFITTYPQTTGHTKAESLKTHLVYELSTYTSEQYVKPALSAIQSAE